VDSLWWVPLLVAPLLALAGIMVFAVWLANRVAEHAIGRQHRLIEEIINTGHVPAAWAGRSQGDTGILRSRARSPRSGKAKVSCLRKLDALITYAENSPLMGDAETKEVVLQRLDEVYDEWARRSPESFRSTERTADVDPPPS
jgi:hypothetical protein